MRRVIGVGIALSVLAMTVAVMGNTTALAASRSCTNTTAFTNPVNGRLQDEPTVGYNTGDIDCFLGVGNQSFAVRILQRSLNTNHCYDAGLQVDGIYGNLTAAAVRAVQGALHIAQDGVYGPQTRSHMLWRTLDVNTGLVTCESSYADTFG